ncbi:MAG TPA: transposase, partial [Pyrinomonadaceae bacterium]|nr:transposase [Pyrinomonadaceae bacterium]
MSGGSRGTQPEVLTPGTNKKHYLAGAFDIVTGRILHVCGERKNRWLFIYLLRLLERKYPATKVGKIYVVADNYRIHKAKAVMEWLAHHHRFG